MKKLQFEYWKQTSVLSLGIPGMFYALHAYVWIFQWRNAPWKWKCYAIWQDAMQYDSTCRDAKCLIRENAKLRQGDLLGKLSPSSGPWQGCWRCTAQRILWGNDPPHGVLAMTKYRDSDTENLLLGKAIAVLATTICERWLSRGSKHRYGTEVLLQGKKPWIWHWDYRFGLEL